MVLSRHDASLFGHVQDPTGEVYVKFWGASLAKLLLSHCNQKSLTGCQASQCEGKLLVVLRSNTAFHSPSRSGRGRPVPGLQHAPDRERGSPGGLQAEGAEGEGPLLSKLVGF